MHVEALAILRCILQDNLLQELISDLFVFQSSAMDFVSNFIFMNSNQISGYFLPQAKNPFIHSNCTYSQYLNNFYFILGF